MSIRGSVDAVTTKGASGWAYAQGRRNGIAVQAVLSHEVIGDAVATDHRSDLAAVGMGNGNCGYFITFYRESDPRYLPVVAVKVDDGDIELPRAGSSALANSSPPFTRRIRPRGGVSRWASGHAHAGVELAATPQGLMARYAVPAGAIAIIGPGTIHRLRCAGDATGVRLYCVPLRATPVTVANDGDGNEIMRQSGVRLWFEIDQVPAEYP